MKTHWVFRLTLALAVCLLVACPSDRSLSASGAGTAAPPETRPVPVVGVPSNEPKPPSPWDEVLKAAGTDVNVSNLVGDEAEVSIDINPLNVTNQVIVGHSADFENMNTFFTRDHGQTWTLSPLGDGQDGLTSDFRFDPAVTFDGHGHVYAVYGADVPGPLGTETTVVLAKSTDGGENYTHFLRLSTVPNVPGPPELPGNDRWFVAAGPTSADPDEQKIYVTMTANLQDPGGLDQRIVLLPSHNGGQSILTSIIVNDGSLGAGNETHNISADPGIGPNGEVYVCWFRSLTREIFIDVSDDGGLDFGTDTRVAVTTLGHRVRIPAQPNRGTSPSPTVDADRSGGPYRGRVYLAYADGIVPDLDVYVTHSDDRGTTWSGPVMVNDDGGSGSQFMPWMDVDPVSGTVAVMWYDTRNDASHETVEVFMAVSRDGGQTFEPNVLVSDTASDQSAVDGGNDFLEYNGIACLNQTAYLVWAGTSPSGDLDFYTDRVTMGGNQPPTADAGADRVVRTGDLVVLDGSGSTDPDNGPAPLTFRWSQTAGPAVALDGADTATPLFVPTEPGIYTFQLIVNDGAADSDPDSVTVTVEEPDSDIIADLIAQVRSLGLRKGVENSLLVKLQAAQAALDRSNTTAAAQQLRALMNHIRAQRGKEIPTAAADVLLPAVQHAIDSLITA